MEGSRAPIFDVIERSDDSAADYAESSFAFLNRAAGPFWDYPRALIQEWCDHFPADEYADIRSRLRSRDDGQHNSAFLEVYLHETLRRTGHRITIHPELPHTNRHPDFYAEKDGAGFYVEAISPGGSKQESAARARRNRLIDVVNRLDDPNFYLWLRSLTEGKSDPNPARLRSALRSWLRGLDPDSITDLAAAPRLRWKEDDWAAEFVAIPLDRDARGKPRPDRRAIAVDGHQQADWVNDASTITRALEAKHHEYGELDEPFLLAVGLFMHDRDRWHSTNAFFGHEQVMFTEDGDAPTFRRGDGYFGAPSRWENTNVSGVVLVNQLQAYHLHKTDSALWVHPGADRELPDLDWPGDTLTLVDNQLLVTPATTLPLEFFGITEPWPETH